MKLNRHWGVLVAGVVVIYLSLSGGGARAEDSSGSSGNNAGVPPEQNVSADRLGARSGLFRTADRRKALALTLSGAAVHKKHSRQRLIEESAGVTGFDNAYFVQDFTMAN